MNKTDLKKMKMLARKAGNTLAVTAIDSVLNEVDVIEARNNKDLKEDEVMSVIKNTITSLQKTVEKYKEINREDRTQEFVDHINYLQTLLPKQLSEDEIRDAIDEMVSTVDLTDKSSMGKVMGQLKGKYGASIDMTFASKYIRDIIQ